MKYKFTTSIKRSLKKDGLLILKINLLRDLSFNVMIDTSVKYNLIESNFIYFQVNEDYDTYFEDQNYQGNFIPSEINICLFKDFFEKLGTHEIVGDDGVIQIVDKLNFNFEFKGEKYSEIVSVVDLYHGYNKRYHIKKGSIDVVLGSDFLAKHNWIIDYKKLTLSSVVLN